MRFVVLVMDLLTAILVFILIVNVAFSAPTNSNETEASETESSIQTTTMGSDEDETNSTGAGDVEGRVVFASTSSSYIILEEERSTVSGELVFSNTPLEGLVNATSISSEDMSTLASFAFATSTDTPGDQGKAKGTCTHHGKEYFSGESLEQADPCNFCVCVSGYVDCYWKNCPPAPEGCVSLDFEGVCERSLYLCPIPKKGEPLPFPVNAAPTMAAVAQLRPRGEIQQQKLTCDILGVEYKVGELVGVASDPCMECRCALDSLYCSPKCCFQPAETLQDASKASRADDVHWYPVLSNPLKHLRSEFEG